MSEKDKEFIEWLEHFIIVSRGLANKQRETGRTFNNGKVDALVIALSKFKQINEINQ